MVDLDRASALQKGIAQPIYLQLQDLIRDHISSGAWQPGELIPSEQAMVRQFAIARMTVRQALDGLIHDGLLVRVRGKGTYVARPKVERELSRMHGFSEDMRARGMIPLTRLLARDVIPAPEEVSAHLHLEQREAVIYLQRLRFADGAPMALETCYLNYTLCQGILHADLEEDSLYRVLEQEAHIELRHASQELQAALPRKAEAGLLHVSQRQPVLVIRQVTYLRAAGSEQPGIFGRTVYRADRYHFRLEVPR